MSEDDLHQQFEHIVQGLDMPDAEHLDEDHICLWDLTRAVAGMSEASGYLGQFSLMFMEDQEHEFPAQAIPVVKKLILITDMLSRVMSECECEDCTICEDCLAMEEICDNCKYEEGT